MNKAVAKNIFIVLLSGITLFSVLKYVASLKEKQDLLNNLNAANQQIITLEKDKEIIRNELNKEKGLNAQLNAKASVLKNYLIAGKNRLSRLFLDYDEAQERIEGLNLKFSLLKSENMALRKERNKLIQLSQENESLKAKLGSIIELKQAIKELKKKKRLDKVIEGNGGYLIKNGKPTHPAKVKIEVVTLPVSQ